MNRLKRGLIGGGAVIGVGLGAFAMTSALTNVDRSEVMESQTTTFVTAQPLVPAAPGPRPLVFSGEVSAGAAGAAQPALSDDRVEIQLSAGNDDEICFRIQLVPDGEMTGCAPLSDIRTGLVYLANQSHDGPVDVVGIVPDDVATVAIGGTTITVDNNVWHYVAAAGASLSFEVRSQDGLITARPG